MPVANLGLLVRAKDAVITYSDTSAKNLFTLPKDAIVLYFLVDVETAFNDSGTDYLDIGTSANSTYFANNVDVATAGQVMVQETNLGDIGTSMVQVTGTYAGGNSDATAGSARVICVYAHWTNQ